MFCPQCRVEYPEKVRVCPKCGVGTVDRLPQPEPAPDVGLVRVLATGDAGVIAIARSLLDGEEIDFYVSGDGLQDLFGVGRIAGFSFATGPAEFWVREDDAERARELLEALTASDGTQDASHDA
jgi:hypothetical protein